MANQFYSRRHYDRVLNRGTGNPAPTDAERLARYRELLNQMEKEGHVEAAEACRVLIAELQGVGNET